jgi:HEAT repeat protein
MGADVAFLVFWGAVWAVGVPLAIHSMSRQRLRILSDFQGAAAEVGLELVETQGSLTREPRVVARQGGRTVTLEWTVERKAHLLRIVVDGNAAISLEPERPTHAVARALQRETQIGDDAFDDAVHVLGSPLQLRAILDGATRNVVSRLFAGWLDQPIGSAKQTAAKITVRDGDLVAELPVGATHTTASDLAWLVRSLLHHAPRFDKPRDPVQRLAEHLPDDPLWTVRLNGLEMLAASFPKHPATAAVLRRALDDPRLEVRAHAALALGDASALLAISRDSDDDEITARTLRALGNRAPFDALVEILERSVRRRRLAVAAACVAALGSHGEAAVETLGKVLAREAGELAIAAAQALRRTGAPAAEVPLLRALSPAEEPELATAVVAALGTVGGVGAVLPIREAADHPRATRDLRRAARQAIAEIQARMPGATPGQLSVAASAGEAGRVTLADAGERGRLSLRPAGEPVP